MTEAKQCEGWTRHGGAFSFGIPEWVQCKNDATVMITVKHKAEEGINGTMPACKDCWNECIKNKDIKIIKVVPIE